MHQRTLAVLLSTLLVTSMITGIVTATPSTPDEAENGLSASEIATLWSRSDNSYVGQDEYREVHDHNRTAIQQVTNGTDVSFTRPPETAATWTRNDFDTLEPGDSATAVHPTNATLTDGKFVEDAHASIFAAHPATRGHLDAERTPLYVAPNGTLRGFVDYRVHVPDGVETGQTTTDWSLSTHRVDQIRLLEGERTIARTEDTQTPELDYYLSDPRRTTLTLEADIEVELTRTVRTTRGNRTTVRETTLTRTHTVSDSIDVDVYNLSVRSHYLNHPDDRSGVALSQSHPWQGYRLGDDSDQVRGVWRFYTARDTDWDVLVESSAQEQRTIESDAVPVYVHAYPSRIGPRAEPVGRGPNIVTTWGREHTSPSDTVGENIDVGVVDKPYTTTHGMAVYADIDATEPVHVSGIVRGVNATIAPTQGSARDVRPSELSVDIVDQRGTQATLRIELRDGTTGEPIDLSDSDRWMPIDDGSESGYLTVGEQRVETNESGVAVVTLQQPDVYTVQYHPSSWLSQNPAYLSDSTTVRWHPLMTLEGWTALVIEIGWQLLPFLIVLYAGRRLHRMFKRPETPAWRDR